MKIKVGQFTFEGKDKPKTCKKYITWYATIRKSASFKKSPPLCIIHYISPPFYITLSFQ